MSRDDRRSRFVGWLYADLLLVLLIASLSGVGLASGQAEPPTPSPSPISTEDPSPSSRPTPRSPDAGLVLDPISFDVRANTAKLLSGDRKTERDFRAAFSEALAAALERRDLGRKVRAGFCITFGNSPGSVGVGQEIAAAANRQAKRAERRFFRPTALKNYGYGGAEGDPNEVSFEIYLLQ